MVGVMSLHDCLRFREGNLCSLNNTKPVLDSNNGLGKKSVYKPINVTAELHPELPPLSPQKTPVLPVISQLAEKIRWIRKISDMKFGCLARFVFIYFLNTNILHKTSLITRRNDTVTMSGQKNSDNSQ